MNFRFLNKPSFNICLLFCLIITSCIKKPPRKDIIISNFEHNDTLKGTRFRIQTQAIIGISVIDSIILLSTSEKKDFFQALSSDGSLLGKFGKFGVKANEFIGAAYTNQFIYKNSKPHILINDITLNRFSLVDLNNSINNNRTVVSESMEFPKEIIGVNYIFYTGENKLIGSSDNGKGRIFTMNNKSGEIKFTPNFPILPTKLKKLQYQRELYRSILAIKPDRSKIVSAMHIFPRIDIFDVNGNRLQSIILNRKVNEEDLYTVLEDKKLTNFYESICVTDDYIFALNSDQLDVDVGIKPKSVELQIFTWEGQALLSLTIPDYVLQIAYNERIKTLYGLDYTQNKVMKYDLSKYLN